MATITIPKELTKKGDLAKKTCKQGEHGKFSRFSFSAYVCFVRAYKNGVAGPDDELKERTRMRPQLVSTISSFINKLENIPIGWLGLFFIAEMLISARALLQMALIHSTPHSLFPLKFIYTHNWFWALLFSLIFFISYITKSPAIKIMRLLVCGLPIIFIPLLSLIFGMTQNFLITGTWREIFFHISTFVSFHPNLGIFFTIEIVIFLSVIFFYFLLHTSIIKSCAGIVGVYTILSLFAIQGKSILVSTHETIAEVNFFVFLFFCFLILFREFPAKAKALIFNLRPRRFVFLAAFGVIMAMGASYSQHFLPYNFSLGFLLFSLFLLHAALINDMWDIAIDTVSNPDRPYAQGILSRQEMNVLQYSILGIMGALILIIHSFAVAIFTFLNIGASFLYSAARFRKNIFSLIIVAFGESTAVLYGYFVQSPAQTVLPGNVFILFIAFFFLFLFFLPLKDLKDFKGDSAEGVKNITTLFGWEKGKVITALSVFLGYVVFASLAGDPLLLGVSLFFATCGALFVLFYEKVGEQISYVNFFLFIVVVFIIGVTVPARFPTEKAYDTGKKAEKRSSLEQTLAPKNVQENDGAWMKATALAGAPSARDAHTAIWTGTKMIVWGGLVVKNKKTTFFNSGGIYDPITNRWQPISMKNVPSARAAHTAIWTGTKMIVWGGGAGDAGNSVPYNSGGIYDPITNRWQPISMKNVPSARVRHTAIWTGTKMIIWGGEDTSDTYSNSGGIYDPETDTWQPISMKNAPAERSWHTAIWTGTDMIVWGGSIGTGTHMHFFNSGGIYNPATDTWNAISIINAPAERAWNTAIWTGTKMIIVGGSVGDNENIGTYSNSGGIYDPEADVWKPIVDMAMEHSSHTAVWTGTDMIVWGGVRAQGVTNIGGIYDSETDTWQTTVTKNAPQARVDHTAVWTGTKMIVWGGEDTFGTFFNSGGIFIPPESGKK